MECSANDRARGTRRSSRVSRTVLPSAFAWHGRNKNERVTDARVTSCGASAQRTRERPSRDRLSNALFDALFAEPRLPRQPPLGKETAKSNALPLRRYFVAPRFLRLSHPRDPRAPPARDAVPGSKKRVRFPGGPVPRAPSACGSMWATT